jgi:hypothetical protein
MCYDAPIKREEAFMFIFKKRMGSAARRQSWEKKIRAWVKSGLTQSEYCKRNGIPLSSFGNWRRRLGENIREDVSFVRLVDSVDKACGDTVIEIVLSDTLYLRVRENIEPYRLALIVSAFRREA